MPIRAEYRKYYDARWRKLRLAMLEAAGNLCQMCHEPHRLLNVAHLSGDPADRMSLTVLCPRCHSRLNAGRRAAMGRRTRARQQGQLWLSSELEVAPLPVRLWPMRLRQMNLF
jgi:5-methylcytosine-specific restriction endonuclease McrA